MDDIVLAIESGVAGGSLALFRGRQLAASWSDAGSSGKSEALLSQIEALLEREGVHRSSLSTIAVSIGPGSYTGIRIGIATALGLSRALGIRLKGVPLLKAIANAADETGPVLVAVPVGRKGLAWQTFAGSNDAQVEPAIETGELTDLRDAIGKFAHGTTLLHSDLYEALQTTNADLPVSAGIKDIGRDLAAAIGAAPDAFDEGPVPLYAREMSFPTLTGERKVIR
ncbi:MAG: tRNA (adenosine(37)-N6)-threonylcarbamoyltransferase complex dimerization subunit type 1 TsaB [Chloracidobacterium sp.]|nr:tRNA (adenosine(37)-N6)-threonylcarbamoyltransferase complex dimerization subunit type 1 TsaB [Chloracidobacterium sp.]